MTQTVPGESPKALPLRSSAGTTLACESRCIFGGKCHNHTNNVTGKECECPGNGIKEMICNVGAHLEHGRKIMTNFSSVFNSFSIYSAEMASSMVSSSRTQSASDPAPLHAQYVDKPSSAPGNSSSSKQHDSVPVLSSSTTIVSPLRSSSAVVTFSSSVDNKIAAMAKKSSGTLRPSDFRVGVLHFGLIALARNVFMNT